MSAARGDLAARRVGPAPALRGCASGVRGWPWVSLGLSALAAGLAFWPGAFEVLVLDRGGLARGEWWRLLTGHFVHWSPAQAAWDIGVFLVLAASCERRGRGRLLAALAASALGISAGVALLQPALPRYAGLSGIVCTLLAWLALDWLRERWREGSRRAVWLGGGLALAFVFKLGFEWTTGTALFAGDLAPGVVPVPLAHVLGAGLGPLLAARPAEGS